MSVFPKRAGQRFSKCCEMSVSRSWIFARLTPRSDAKCCTVWGPSSRRFLLAPFAHKAEWALHLSGPLSSLTTT